MPRHERAEALAALLVVAELVVARAGRREQHHLARRGGRRGGRHGASRGRRSDAAARCRPGRARAARRPRRSGSGAAARGAPARAGPLKPPPLRLPPRITCTPPVERLDAAPRRRPRWWPSSRSRRARRRRSATSSSRCGTPANVAQRLAHRLGRHTRAPAPRPRRPSRSRGCGRRAGGSRAAGSAARRASELAVAARRSRPAAEAHPRAGPAGRCRRQHRHVVGRLAGEDAQLRLAVGLEACRGGRGGPRSRFSSSADVGRERRRRPRAGSSSTSQTTVASGLERPDERRQRRADVARHRHGQPGRARRSRRAARPWWSCRWCRSRRRSGSAAAARPAPARRCTGDARARAPPRPRAPRCGTPGLLTTQAHARRAAPAPSLSRWTSTPAAAPSGAAAVARRSPRRASRSIARRGHARARQPDDQVRPRAGAAARRVAHGIDCW